MKIKEIRDTETGELTGYQYDGMFVPLDPANRHYQEIQELLGSGEATIEPAFGLEDLRRHKLAKLKSEVRQFIYRHYDDGTQKTLQAKYIEAMQTGDTAKQAMIKQVFAWIDSVLKYYYQKKNEILAATDDATLAGISWDLSLVEETSHVELRDIIMG